MKGLLGKVVSILFAIGLILVFAFFFTIFPKTTAAYDCTMEQVRQSDLVVRALGEPLEPGFFALLSSHESSGSQSQTIFSTGIEGPRGKGRIRADAYRAPAGSYLLVQFKGEGDWTDVYNGSYPC